MGVAGGFLQGGGFGSWSKEFGIAAASLLEAEVVTADGTVRIANACSEPDLYWAAVTAAVAPINALVPGAGSYVNEGDYFERDWQQRFWGANYARLLAIKHAYDPSNVFTCHHCVGSERRGSSAPTAPRRERMNGWRSGRSRYTARRRARALRT